jgi:APA family basic amino acid/polyamine antiporter
MPRQFRTPWFPVTQILGAVMSAFLLMSLMGDAATRNFFSHYLLIGVVLYFVYGMWNTNLGKGIVVHGHEVMADSPHPKVLDRS